MASLTHREENYTFGLTREEVVLTITALQFQIRYFQGEACLLGSAEIQEKIKALSRLKEVFSSVDQHGAPPPTCATQHSEAIRP